MAERTQDDNSGNDEQPARRAVFRVPLTAIMVVVFFAICMTPIAGQNPWLALTYLFPIALIVWLVRTRTEANGSGLAVHTLFGTRSLPWTELKGLALTKRAKVRAVLTDGTEVALPAVRTRHLPVLSLVSGGRLRDPSGLLEQEENRKAADEE